jgi:translation initiation factor 2 alpha subunit (eIF-2alpha)
MMKEGDIVLCTVKEVTNTATTVKLETGEEGIIISSEIAPGRIKFMRQYVVPNKKVVCKVLGNSGGRLSFSLRRVSSKEKKEVMENFKQEQALKMFFKQIFKEESDKIIQGILKDFGTMQEFIIKAKEEEDIIKKYIPKENFDAIKKIIEKKKKSHELRYNLSLKCLEEDGLNRIKSVLKEKEMGLVINYISAGNFKAKLVVEDFKEGKKKMGEILERIEKKAKENKCEFFANEEK